MRSGKNASRYISASKLAKGAPNIQCTPYYIDIAKAKASGARIHTTENILSDLNRLASEDPRLRFRVDLLKKAITEVEGEVLIEGKVPASAVKSPLSMNLTRSLRGVQFVCIALTVVDLTRASRESIRQRSAIPIAAEGIRQSGSWSGALAGARIGGMAGAALGIETGPGAILAGAAGALIFGTAGYFGADWIAHWALEKMIGNWLRKFWRVTPAPEREWELCVDGAALALLRHPRLDDMFWVSLQIVPLTTPADPRLVDDDFWLDRDWTLVERGTGQVARYVIASASGLRRVENRVLLRGLDSVGNAESN